MIKSTLQCTALPSIIYKVYYRAMLTLTVVAIFFNLRLNWPTTISNLLSGLAFFNFKLEFFSPECVSIRIHLCAYLTVINTVRLLDENQIDAFSPTYHTCSISTDTSLYLDC